MGSLTFKTPSALGVGGEIVYLDGYRANCVLLLHWIFGSSYFSLCHLIKPPRFKLS